MQLVPGTLIDRYRVEAEIGRGGMARVYRVRHKNLDTVHALKVLTLASEELRERLLREGKLQSQLDHPNIVPVRDVIDLEQGFGLLMDYIEGSSLDHWLLESSPDRAQRERIFLEIVEGVDFAHQRGVVHRDLKPGNVMMELRRGSWTPRVADFGLAKLVDGEGDSGPLQSRTGRPMGTPAYMAPEQIRSAKHVDHRADVFALGCILYELMCERRAFIGNDSLDVFNRVTQGHYMPPRQAVEGLEPRIEQAIFGSLAVDADQRIPDCTTLAAVVRGEVTWELPAPADATFMGGDDFAGPGAISHTGSPTPAATLDFGNATTLPRETSPPNTAPTEAAPVTALDPSEPPTDARSEPRAQRGSSWLAPALLTAVLVLLCLGGAALSSGIFSTPAEPAPVAEGTTTEGQVTVTTPSPVTVTTTAPVTVVNSSNTPPPSETAPLPTAPPAPALPVPTAPVKPAKTTSVAKKPSGPPAHLGRVTFGGDARLVRLRSADGTFYQAGDVPPGSYLIEAAFDAGPPMHAGNLVVQPGKSLRFDCRASTMGCSP